MNYFLSKLSSVFLYSLLISSADSETEDTIIVYGDLLNDEFSSQENTTVIVNQEDFPGTFTRNDVLPAYGAALGSPSLGDFSIRGLNNESIFNAYGLKSNSIIATLINGVPHSATTIGYFPRLMSNTESITILKGGQSTSYGVDSIGGVVAFEDQEPTFDWSGAFGAEYSSFNTIQAHLTQNLSLSNELALRLHYNHFESDGSFKNEVLDIDDWAKENRDYYHAQLQWEPNDQLTMKFIAEYEEAIEAPAGLAKEFGGYSFNDRRSDFNTRSYYKARRNLYNLHTTYVTKSDLTVKSNLGYNDLYATSLSDLDSGNTQNWFGNTIHDEFHWTHDLLVKYEGEKWDWAIGNYLQKSNYVLQTKGVIGLPVPGIGLFDTNFDSIGDEDTSVASLYGKAKYRFNDNFSLTAGLRLTQETRELDTTFSANILPGTLESSESNHLKDILPSLALHYTPNEQWDFILKGSRNYRSGGIAFAPSQAITREFDAEYSNDLEFITRYNTGGYNLSTSLFFSKMEDIQIPYAIPNGVQPFDLLIENNGKALRYGVELNLEKELIPNLNLRANLTLLKTKLEDTSVNGTTYPVDEFPNAPTLTSYLALQYQPAEGFFGNLSWSWVDQTYTQLDSPETTSIGVRSNVDLTLGYKTPRHSVYFFVKNVLDNDFANAKRDFSGTGAGAAVAYMNNPRTFGLGYKFNW